MFRPALTRFLALCSAALLPIACLHPASVKPDATAQSVPGRPLTALAEVGGVRVLATGDAWERQRRQISDRVVPIEIRIENHSGRSLRISHENFSLDGNTGASYPAIAGQESARIGENRYRNLLSSARYQPMSVYVPVSSECDQQDLVKGPYLAYSYTGPSPGIGGLQPYSREAYDSVCPAQAITPEMLAKALPEGPLPDGASTSGFVYFQGLGKRESTVRLNVNLVDSGNRQPLAKASIPLAVTR
jgi:hypothetical protein